MMSVTVRSEVGVSDDDGNEQPPIQIEITLSTELIRILRGSEGVTDSLATLEKLAEEAATLVERRVQSAIDAPDSWERLKGPPDLFLEDGLPF